MHRVTSRMAKRTELVRVQHVIDGNGELHHQDRCRRCLSCVSARFRIVLPLESKDRDGIVWGIDDPILRNAGFGIIASLVDEISLGLVFTDNFQSQIGTGQKRFCRRSSVAESKSNR